MGAILLTLVVLGVVCGVYLDRRGRKVMREGELERSGERKLQPTRVGPAETAVRANDSEDDGSLLSRREVLKG